MIVIMYPGQDVAFVSDDLTQARQMVANDFCTSIENIANSLGKHSYRGKEYQFLHGTKVEELYLMG